MTASEQGKKKSSEQNEKNSSGLDSTYRPPDGESHSSDDDDDLGDLTQEDLLGMSEVDRIKWQEAKEKKVQEDAAGKEKRPKKNKDKHIHPETPVHPNKTRDKQTPPPTGEKHPKITKNVQTLSPTAEKHLKRTTNVQTPPSTAEKQPKNTKNVQTSPPTQEERPNKTKDIQTPKTGGTQPAAPAVKMGRGPTQTSHAPKGTGSQGNPNTIRSSTRPVGRAPNMIPIKVIYKGELPYPRPQDFNCMMAKRRLTEDDDDTGGQPSAKRAKTNEPYHDTRIDGIDFKIWNSSWLMRLSQLKGLPARPPHDVDNPATLHIALIDQLEDKEQEDSVASNAYGGSKRVEEPAIPLIASNGDIYFHAKVDIDLFSYSSLEVAIRTVLLHRGIELKAGQLRIYASLGEAYAPDAITKLLKSRPDELRSAALRTQLDAVWKTVYVWKYGKEILEKEERRKQKVADEAAAAAAAAAASAEKDE